MHGGSKILLSTRDGRLLSSSTGQFSGRLRLTAAAYFFSLFSTSISRLHCLRFRPSGSEATDRCAADLGRDE